MLELCDLTAGYDRHPAVHHIAARFRAGSLTAIIGPNGGGKSTLLKAIMGMIPLMSGHIILRGVTMRDCAYMPQQSEIDRDFPLRAADLVNFGHWRRAGAYRLVTPAMQQRTDEALRRVGMFSFKERPVSSLSVGQFQRILFARIIVQDARLILLDEPFAPIDSKTVADLVPLLKQWRAEGRAVLLVAHDPALVRESCPNAMLLAREVVAYGATADVMEPANLHRARLLAESWEDRAPQCDRDLLPPGHRHDDDHDHGHHHPHHGHRP